MHGPILSAIKDSELNTTWPLLGKSPLPRGQSETGTQSPKTASSLKGKRPMQGLQGAKLGEMIRDGQGIGQSLWHGSGADALGFACQELTAPHL